MCVVDSQEGKATKSQLSGVSDISKKELSQTSIYWLTL
jgi:hypothetical protein